MTRKCPKCGSPIWKWVDEDYCTRTQTAYPCSNFDCDYILIEELTRCCDCEHCDWVPSDTSFPFPLRQNESMHE